MNSYHQVACGHLDLRHTSFLAERLNRGQRLVDEPRIRTMGVMVTELVTLLCQRAGLRHPFHLCLLLFSGFRLGGMLSFILV